MAQTATLENLTNLPAEQRLELIEVLWDSLDADAESMPLADWQVVELDKRLDALDADLSAGASWVDVRRRISGQP